MDLEYPNHGASMTQQSYFKRRTMTDYPCPNWLIALKHITATICYQQLICSYF